MNHEFFLIAASSDTTGFLTYFPGFVCCLILMLTGLLIGWVIWKGFGYEAQRLDDETRRMARILKAREKTLQKHRDKIAHLSHNG